MDLQTSCELYQHPIRERIETRYNAVSKTENDVFSEKDFTIKAGNRCKLSLVFLCLLSNGQQGKNAPNTDSTGMMGLYSILAMHLRYRLMLGALHLVVLHTTLVEQSSQTRLQASLQTRSTSIIWRR